METIEKLRQELNLKTEKKVSELRADIETTIVLLQAILDKPENVMIFLDTDPETRRAHWERYQYKQSPSEISHSIVSGTYSSKKLSYPYASALEDFLERIEVCDCRQLELPRVESNEILIAELEKKIETTRRYRDGSITSLARYEKELPELEAMLSKLKEG